MELNEEIISRICETDLFLSVSCEELSLLLKGENIEFEEYKNSQLIYSGEKYRSAIGFIVRGSAKVVKKDSTLIVGRLFENDIFGCQALFLSNSYFPNEIFSVGETQVLYIKKGAVAALMQLKPNFSLDYIRYLSKRIYFLNKRIVSFTGGTAESRLANYLVSSFGDYKTYVLDIPMNQLAISLDIGRASLYRAFDKLIEAGAVEKKGKIIRLTDKDALISFIS